MSLTNVIEILFLIRMNGFVNLRPAIIKGNSYLSDAILLFVFKQPSLKAELYLFFQSG